MDARTQGQQQTGFLAELRRRRVLQIGAAYLVGAWLAVEVLGFLLEQAGVPDQALRWVAIAFIAGFPVSVILAWVIQVQPDGAWAIDRSSSRAGTLLGAAAFAALLTGGLAWLTLPGPDSVLPEATYQPIPNSIAILPFAWADATPGERSVARSLFDALDSGLDEARGLSMIRLNLSERPGDVLDFGRSIRSAVLLTGEIVTERAVTRIQARVIDLSTGRTAWSSGVDWDATRIIEIGAEIANGALVAMGLEAISKQRFAGTDNREAYQLYLDANETAASMVTADLRVAIADLERALELDPNFVRAYTTMAVYVRWSTWDGSLADQKKGAARSKALLEKALEMDPDSPDALSLLARESDSKQLSYALWDRVLQVDPAHFETLHRYASWKWRDGEVAEAERLMRQALQYEPMDANAISDLGSILIVRGKREDGVALIRRSMELEPNMPQNYKKLWGLHLKECRFDQAIYYGRRIFESDPGIVTWRGQIAGTYAELELEEQARTWASLAEPVGSEGEIDGLMMFIESRLDNMPAVLDYQDRMIASLPEDQGGEKARLTAWRAVLARDPSAAELFEAPAAELYEGAWPEVERANWTWSLRYALALRLAGRRSEARALFSQMKALSESVCGAGLDSMLGWCQQRQSERWMILAALEQREALLEELRRANSNMPLYAPGGRRVYAWGSMGLRQVLLYDRYELLDFIEDDPEFQRIVQSIRDDIARQRENVLRMEASGEMPPIPEVAMN